LFCGIEKGLVISFDLKTGEHAYPIMHVLDVVNRLAENRNSNRKKATSLENISANEASLVATGFDNGVVAVFDPVESTCVGCWGKQQTVFSCNCLPIFHSRLQN